MLAPLDKPDKKRLTVRRTFAPKVRVTPTAALKQRVYRNRRDQQEIRPPVPITGQTVDLLITMAVKYGRLSRREAEAKALNRRWLVDELVRLLDKLATDLGIAMLSTSVFATSSRFMLKKPSVLSARKLAGWCGAKSKPQFNKNRRL
jgi:hypothetical protein